MIYMRLRYRIAGNHVHVRWYSGKDWDHLGLNGSLTFKVLEWEFAKAALEDGMGDFVQFVDMGSETGIIS